MLDTQEAVTGWLQQVGLDHYAARFATAGVRGERLDAMTAKDLLELGIAPGDVGPLMLAIAALIRGDAPPTMPGPTAPDYALALSAEVADFCRALASDPPAPWVVTVSEQWPGPVAHEYHRLRELLEAGQLVPAIWQLKDLAETLVKFPALVMARDLISHGGEAAAREVRRALFGGQLTFGAWVGLVERTVAPAARQAGSALVCPRLPLLFITAKDRATDWLKTLNTLVTWRNDVFGHGAFRLDPADFTDDLRRYVGVINQALAEQAAAGVWDNARLHSDGPEAIELTGWQTIRHRHFSAAATHVEVELPLVLDMGERSLRLAPLLALRRCAICGKQDVFFYDSRASRGSDSGFIFIDYLAGHRMSAPRHRLPDLAAEADLPESAVAIPQDRGTVDDPYGDRELEALLLEKALEARYMEPTYLRQPLLEFIRSHDRGVFWLSAPGHTGKSMFVKGLADPVAVNGRPLGSDILVAALFIKREILPTARDLRNFLTEQVLKDGFGLSERGADFPQLDTKAAEPAQAFVQQLQAVMALKPARINQVILCLDGLDELPEPTANEKSLAEFLPPPEALPAGLYLLLTSRPLEECPPPVRQVLRQRFPTAGAFQQATLMLDEQRASTDPLTAGYLALLRAYYEREIAERRLGDVRQALLEFINGRSEVVCVDDLTQRLTQDQQRPLAEAARREWTDLTRGRVTVRSSAGVTSLTETVVLPVVQRYDAAFRTILDKAGSRFLYVAHLTGLVRDRTLALEALAEVPGGAGLYAHFLRQLERTLAGSTDGLAKTWEFVQRLILVLAAVEQAHEWDYRLEPAGYNDPEFRGVPLDVLAELLGEPGRTYKLVFALYSVKEILAVWKGESARDASYRLGLKDFVATVTALWPDRLAAAHSRLARWALDELPPWGDRTDEHVRDEHVQAGLLLAYAALSGDEALEEQVHRHPGVRDLCLSLGNRRYEKARLRLATQWYSRAGCVARQVIERQPTVENHGALAVAIMNKGVALRGLGQLAAAVGAYEEAITIYRRLVEAEGRDELANDLAGAIMNKGVALAGLGQLAAAVGVYEEAITIYRRVVEAEGRGELANDLAGAIMNKGVALAGLGQLAAAVGAYEEAITLWEQGVTAGLTHWLPDLVKAYGIHFDAERRGEAWEPAADDVVRVLVHLAPLLRSGSLSELLKREFAGFMARLRALSPQEREKLYVALGDAAEVVKGLIEE